MIVGFSGKKGSGKDLSGMIWQALMNKPTAFDNMEVVTEEDVIYKVWDNPSFKNVKFADTLKDFICMLLGCTRDQLEDRHYKEAPLPQSWWYYKLGNGKIVERGSFKNPDDNQMCEERYLVKTTPRLLLQLMGTECGRDILHPNLWVNAVISNYKPDSNWVITDMRFPNELKAVKKRGVTIRVNRAMATLGMLEDEHPSETALDGAEFDYVIENNGTIKDLVDKIRSIIIKENLYES